MVGAGMKVTRRARRLPVAANLRIPEQRLAENQERLLVGDVLLETWPRGDRDTLERRNGISATALSARPSVLV